MLQVSCSETNVALEDGEVHQLADIFYNELGKQPEHTISKDEFVQLLKSNPNLQR